MLRRDRLGSLGPPLRVEHPPGHVAEPTLLALRPDAAPVGQPGRLADTLRATDALLTEGVDRAGRQQQARLKAMASAAGFLPELDVARVQRWCEGRVLEHARHQVRVECEVNGSYLTIVECRAPWRADVGPEWTCPPIARLRYTKASRTWTLYWRDRNLRFHRYDPIQPSTNVSELIDELDRDLTNIFWG